MVALTYIIRSGSSRSCRYRAAVNDPALADLRTPGFDDYPLFAKPPPLDHGYFEAFNRDNCISSTSKKREAPVEITGTRVRTTLNAYDFDTIVLATGFKACTGALEAFPIHGEGGRTK